MNFKTRMLLLAQCVLRTYNLRNRFVVQNTLTLVYSIGYVETRNWGVFRKFSIILLNLLANF